MMLVYEGADANMTDMKDALTDALLDKGIKEEIIQSTEVEE